ncbi:MAG TPA: histidine phosphatase family protein [Pseudoalteromonas prydzensis]|uniref:Histidine phosphatase family protein n=1 Tax=Pseudoalteromonas prydzensis TaxID=182141 RepID=A0A7V1GDM2_9GAMM|nr:histidine phosphatase family protein [Pseudoalteromonas prydzensis]HEA15397.1 histidine phosphatase family protein [Pseudoalteromonas prydzensis]
MKYVLASLILLFAVNLSAAPDTVFLFRHSEKLTGKDPQLSDAGKQRAQQLVSLLSKVQPNAIFSTDYNRTIETATPLAEYFDMPIETYEPGDLAKFKQTVLAQSGVVVVVGHSNTTAKLAELIAQVIVEKMPETEFDRYFILQKVGQGYQLSRLKMNF